MPNYRKNMGRREALALIGVTGAALAAGCSGESPISPSAATASTNTGTTGTTGTAAPATAAGCAVTPSETIGPYPSLVDLFRSDIREGKSGTQLDLAITVVNTVGSCAPLSGVNVEIWQCDADGNYSQYGSERAQTYLRGIQTTDANGQVRFTTVYPGWYRGRATHIHVEVTRNNQSLKVTQIAFPDAVNNEVYGAGVYASRGSNPTTNTRDGIFADSINSEMASITGNPSSGYAATFTIGLAA